MRNDLKYEKVTKGNENGGVDENKTHAFIDRVYQGSSSSNMPCILYLVLKSYYEPSSGVASPSAFIDASNSSSLCPISSTNVGFHQPSVPTNSPQPSLFPSNPL